MENYFNRYLPDKNVLKGVIAAMILLGIYFGITAAISGFAFAKRQFADFWYFIISLVAGFGVQIGLYSYLRIKIREQATKKVAAISGTTSTIAMLSCCAHYLANLIPIIGIAGTIALIAQYQIELFWVGIAFNVFGIMYSVRKIILFLRMRDE
ncbi:MAG: hypothetical protein HYW78_00225 [Parcubacteria group bacterium]|nr:hypothetical protein [Parcubacteria group bacterium]